MHPPHPIRTATMSLTTVKRLPFRERNARLNNYRFGKISTSRGSWTVPTTHTHHHPTWSHIIQTATGEERSNIRDPALDSLSSMNPHATQSNSKSVSAEAMFMVKVHSTQFWLAILENPKPCAGTTSVISIRFHRLMCPSYTFTHTLTYTS